MEDMVPELTAPSCPKALNLEWLKRSDFSGDCEYRYGEIEGMRN